LGRAWEKVFWLECFGREKGSVLGQIPGRANKTMAVPNLVVRSNYGSSLSCRIVKHGRVAIVWRPGNKN
jgi:hypothetical protein